MKLKIPAKIMISVYDSLSSAQPEQDICYQKRNSEIHTNRRVKDNWYVE